MIHLTFPFPLVDDIWPHYEREEGAEEPDWVQAEREQFGQHRDKDGDGKLDKTEISHWILPQDYDHAEAEARHLIYEADTNKVHTHTHREREELCFWDRN